jgi:hypothetical protein
LLQPSVASRQNCQLTLEPCNVAVAGAEEAEAARLRHGERKPGISDEIHRSKYDRMLDA